VAHANAKEKAVNAAVLFARRECRIILCVLATPWLADRIRRMHSDLPFRRQ
jgi:hypothetical protein